MHLSVQSYAFFCTYASAYVIFSYFTSKFAQFKKKQYLCSRFSVLKNETNINYFIIMKKVIFSLATIMLMTTACTTKQQTTGIDLANLDTTAIPQNDFYQYACGGWMAANPLTWGTSP